MSVVALFNLIAIKHLEYVVVVIIGKYRRIMHKYERFELRFQRRLYRRLKALHFPAKDLFVLNVLAVVSAVYPAACTAYAVILIDIVIVVEYAYGREALICEEILHFAHSRPPIIVVALEDYLPAGQSVYEAEVRKRLLERHSPRNVPCQHDRVIWLDHFPPVFLYPLLIVLPAVKDAHRL